MGARAVLEPPKGRRGFPVYPERPRVVIGKRKQGPLPSDIELYHSYWLVSDRLKTLFERYDPAAFAFQPCDVRLRDGSPGPAYWLCGAVRVVEAFGEKTMQEIRDYYDRTGIKHLNVLSRTDDLDFNEASIGAFRVFCTPYSPQVFCDQGLKDACKAAGMKGVDFHDCSPRRKRAPPPPEQEEPRRSRSYRELCERLLTCGDAGNAVSLAIAARSALRTIPLLERLSWAKPLRKRMRPSVGRPRISNSDIVLGCFRSAATVWVAALCPAFAASKRFDAIKHHARMAGGAEDAGNTPASCVGSASEIATEVAISIYDRDLVGFWSEEETRKNCAQLASVTTEVVADAFMEAYAPEAAHQVSRSRDPNWIFNRELSAPERSVWDAAKDDVRHWEERRDARALLLQPLWLTQAPPYAQDDWRQLVARLRARADERWAVWIDWYEARLDGRADVSDTAEIARIALKNDAWSKGAAAVNASISRRIVAQR
jgi:hypothetical protein